MSGSLDTVISENKIRHMHGVAEFMYRNAERFGLNKEEMYTLGLLHDIGYLYGKDNHGVSGADLLRNLGFTFSDIVAYHGKKPEYYLLVHFEKESLPPELVLLLIADLSIDSKGNEVGPEGRLTDIKLRYGSSSEEYVVAVETVAWLVGMGGFHE